jgi:LAO/AO transport system kinase
MKEILRQEIMKKAVDSKLPCADARKIAEDLGVPYSEVGAAADELGVKIKNCQLGCF